MILGHVKTGCFLFWGHMLRFQYGSGKTLRHHHRKSEYRDSAKDLPYQSGVPKPKLPETQVRRGRGGAWYIVGIRTHRPSWYGAKKSTVDIMVTRSSLEREDVTSCVRRLLPWILDGTPCLNVCTCYSASSHLDLEKPTGDSLRALRVGPVSQAQVVKNEGVFAKLMEIRCTRSGNWDAGEMQPFSACQTLTNLSGVYLRQHLIFHANREAQERYGVRKSRGTGARPKLEENSALYFREGNLGEGIEDWLVAREETPAPNLKGRGKARMEWRVQSLLTGGSVTSLVKLHEGSCKSLDKTTRGGDPWETVRGGYSPNHRLSLVYCQVSEMPRTSNRGVSDIESVHGATRPATNRENVEWKN
ncbi:hypothetical protein EDB89DRAFT_1908047 [Lactarius sanguifluus]|nr:hypothetical protein EDB89DRAFT_1908047 [Lactarius sanguifluus]